MGDKRAWRHRCEVELLANFIAAIIRNLTVLTHPPNPNPARFLSMSGPFLGVVDPLFRAMYELVPTALYERAHVRPIPGRIPGTAFFPGGSGLHLDGPAVAEFPLGGVMILGHNFDSVAGFQASFERGREDVQKGTWGALLQLPKHAEIPVEACFFTNAFLGLCEGDDNKKYLGRGNLDFRAACLRFLKAQIETQLPRFILTLGLHVPPLLAAASPDLGAWAGKNKGHGCDRRLHLRDLDAAPFFSRARFELGEGSTHSAAVAAIAHPSDRRNGARRGAEWRREVVGGGWLGATRSFGCRRREFAGLQH